MGGDAVNQKFLSAFKSSPAEFCGLLTMDTLMAHLNLQGPSDEAFLVAQLWQKFENWKIRGREDPASHDIDAELIFTVHGRPSKRQTNKKIVVTVLW